LFLRFKSVVPLCHTKLFEGESRGLDFTGSGYCVAFHVPNTKRSRELLRAVDELDIRLGCIANLVKDSRLTSETVERQYGSQVAEFRARITNFDADLIFSNRIAEELLGF